DSITEVYSDRFVYPDAALVFSKFDARYFNEIPSRSYNVRLLKVKVPINYDPITKNYTGPWNGKFKVAWTDNPAWCFYDLITNNRYGLGKYIDSTLTDKWTLYEIAQYCDQLVSDGSGGLEPRFKCNLYINTKEEAYKVLNDMASIFRAIVYYSAGQITVSQDSLKEPIYIFNNSNVLNGDFNYSDSSKKSRKTVAFVRYNDENDNYKPAIEYVENKEAILKYGIRETQISAFGCTSKNQAKRIGKWILTTDNFETEIVDFQAGLEGIFLKPGDIISVYDQNRKNQVYGGRTLQLTNAYAILDVKANASNLNFLTGVLNDFNINILTPTYNLNPGTQMGDMYITGMDITSSGTTGINNSFLRRSQVQSIKINNPSIAIESGNDIYSKNIKVTFPTLLDNINYNLPQNTVWTIDLNENNYNFNKSNTIRSPINNDSRIAYPGYYLEPYLNKPKKYRILNISEKEDSVFSINALEYNDKKYEDIDNIGNLVNVPIKAASPVAPRVFLSGIFRSPSSNSYCATSPCNGTHFTTNQGGINSIMYNIIPQDNINNSLYYVYAKPYVNYLNSVEAPEQYLVGVLSSQNIRTGLTTTDWIAGTIPPFLTPTGAGIYYFRVFSENSIGERSSPVNSSYNLTAQASIFTVQASGFNIY
ncbi:MAG: host specificity protein J, partial [Caulobacteraceae bacterium]|nr:host specificity protein J [Caulobacteraceae bacterium]